MLMNITVVILWSVSIVVLLTTFGLANARFRNKPAASIPLPTSLPAVLQTSRPAAKGGQRHSPNGLDGHVRSTFAVGG